MKTSIPKIRNVRFKAGENIRLLQPPEQTEIERGLRTVVELQIETLDIIGFALITWDEDGIWSGGYAAGRIPVECLPEYAKLKLQETIDAGEEE